jgi:hypothetical protein
MKPHRAVASGLAVLCATLACARAEGHALVLANARVVDVAQGVVTAPVDIEIVDNRIAAIRPASARRPGGSPVHDARGGFLVPGFWDMHAHVNSREHAENWALPLFVAAGVTGVRDMAGDCFEPGCRNDIAFMRSLQARIARGELIGPRIVAVASALIEGPRERSEGAAPWSAPANEAQSRTLVRELARRGVDFIKPYDTMPRPAYFELLRSAREAGLPVSGHVPMSVSSVEAVQAGQTTIEHAKHPLLDCSRNSRAFHETFAAWATGESARIYTNWANGSKGDNDLGGYYQPILAGFDPTLCKQVIQAIAASGAHYVPTLITRRFEALADSETFLADARLRLVPPALRASWADDAGRYRTRFAASAQEKQAYLEFYERAVQLVGEAYAAGVPILVGTDAPDSYCFPGSGLLDEMRELRRAGLSNAAILKAATLDAAKFMHLDTDHGSIAPGKIADLVLLPGNPLEDIEHAARPRAVIFDGRLLDESALRALEARAADAAQALQSASTRR